jgi:hypothetical protein
MRFLFLLAFFIAFAPIARADEVSLDSLPQAVRDTVNEEKGDGMIAAAETYDWAGTIVYKVIVNRDGVPDLEFHVSDAGKLIRVEHLREEPDDSDDD